MIKTRETGPQPVMTGWIARDKEDNPFVGTGLHLHYAQPYRDGDEWSGTTLQMHLPWEAFPEIEWKDEPVEVEVYVVKKKN